MNALHPSLESIAVRAKSSDNPTGVVATSVRDLFPKQNIIRSQLSTALEENSKSVNSFMLLSIPHAYEVLRAIDVLNCLGERPKDPQYLAKYLEMKASIKHLIPKLPVL